MAKAQIIRGSTQSVPIDISSIFPDPINGRNLAGGKAYLTVKPESAVNTDTVDDNAAVIKIDLTFVTHPASNIISFPLAPADTNTVAIGTYAWGAQTKESNGTITEFQFDPKTVDVIADVTRRTN